ncbi:60S ribosomal export protein NMD3 [Methanocorpusculum sp. MG]|uniref:60S ribosomal export protein NMD3 n=1 Tax=Methanocorpusculum petauri TaxID=3002863 RepID=A0ABT4ID42_9EURY|nr:60S ribosomal export protein NMD3 [Methanocorpusculum petauri]MCZ0859659.1 60S ribosomal export protein NMD3 [Methanocorpusculum petauri]
MTLTSGFCPKCGAPSVNGELCGNCRVKDTVWITIQPRVECICCPSCGSTKTAGIWSDCQIEREELAETLVNSAISIHKDVQNIQKDIHIVDISVNRSIATVFVSGTLYGVPLETTQKVKIVWAREQCDRCCRISGSYYEGVIQVRATGRKPTSFELRRAAEIAYQIEDQLQTAGDRLSFVSDIDEQKDGIDIIFSSQTIGSAISHDICGALGGSFTTHPKLVGEKAGIKLYRVTYSIRLPRFSRGDIIRHGRGYFRILRQTKDMLFVHDLATGQSRNFREEDSDVFIANIHTAEPAAIVYRDAGILGILDPATQEVREIPDYAWIEADAGDTILIVRDHDTLIAAGKTDESPQDPEEPVAGMHI